MSRQLFLTQSQALSKGIRRISTSFRHMSPLQRTCYPHSPIIPIIIHLELLEASMTNDKLLPLTRKYLVNRSLTQGASSDSNTVSSAEGVDCVPYRAFMAILRTLTIVAWTKSQSVQSLLHIHFLINNLKLGALGDPISTTKAIDQVPLSMHGPTSILDIDYSPSFRTALFINASN